MVVIGLTGGIATGKSTVSSIFGEHGIPVIDADLVARQVVEPGKGAYNKIRKEFGSEFFDDEKGGILKREQLGKLIFNNPEKRRRLNAITHPAIRWEMLKQLLWHLLTGCRYIVLDTPLLFEVGYDKVLSTTVVVWCDSDKELVRLMARDGLSEEDSRARISSQMSIEEKKRKATILLDNNGSMEELRQQVESLINQLDASWIPLIARFSVAGIVGGITYLIAKGLLWV